jgi:hypothetical protein
MEEIPEAAITKLNLFQAKSIEIKLSTFSSWGAADLSESYHRRDSAILRRT